MQAIRILFQDEQIASFDQDELHWFLSMNVFP